MLKRQFSLEWLFKEKKIQSLTKQERLLESDDDSNVSLCFRVGSEVRQQVLPEVPARAGRGQPGVPALVEAQDGPRAGPHHVHTRCQRLGRSAGTFKERKCPKHRVLHFCCRSALRTETELSEPRARVGNVTTAREDESEVQRSQ